MIPGKEKEAFYNSSSKRSGRRREVDTIALKSVLSGVIEHVRVGYILPPNSDLLLNALRQRLLHKPVMDLDVASSSSRQISPWLQSRHERSYVKPRLFTPYFEEAKVSSRHHPSGFAQSCRYSVGAMISLITYFYVDP